MVTVSLRECTCSHFLLFVWGGLADLHRTKPQHQSYKKGRKETVLKHWIAVVKHDTVRLVVGWTDMH